MPIDINELRDYKGGDPAKWRKHMAARFKPEEWVDEVLAEDEKWRELTKVRNEKKTDLNKFQKEVIAPKKKAKEDCDEEVAQMKVMKAEIDEIDKQIPEAEASRDTLLNRIGNIVDP